MHKTEGKAIKPLSMALSAGGAVSARRFLNLLRMGGPSVNYTFRAKKLTTALFRQKVHFELKRLVKGRVTLNDR